MLFPMCTCQPGESESGALPDSRVPVAPPCGCDCSEADYAAGKCNTPLHGMAKPARGANE